MPGPLPGIPANVNIIKGVQLQPQQVIIGRVEEVFGGQPALESYICHGGCILVIIELVHNNKHIHVIGPPVLQGVGLAPVSRGRGRVEAV